MATTRKVRVALALPKHLDEVLTAISKYTNTPKTHIITEFLIDTMPVFHEVLKAIEASKQGQQAAAYDAMAGFLAKVSTDLNNAHLDLGEFKGKHVDK
jgi:predicted DNA-binding protein